MIREFIVGSQPWHHGTGLEWHLVGPTRRALRLTG